MHYARGLVRPAASRSLRVIEAKAARESEGPARCTARLIDACGAGATVTLLHPAEMTKRASRLPIEEALAEIDLLAAALRSTTEPASPTPHEEALYVRGSVADAKAEITVRQERFLEKLRGKLLATDFDRTGSHIKALLSAAAAGGQPFADGDLAAYRGIVEELCGVDYEAALAVAINSKLPPLNAGAGGALARRVDVNTQSAVNAFLAAFRPRDEGLPAFETCATQLAIRLRAAADAEGDAAPSPSELLQGQGGEGEERQRMLSECLVSHNVDPGSVFPNDAAAVQRWAAGLVEGSDATVAELAARVRAEVTSRRLLPRRVTMDALSTWCLTDLSRAWVGYAAAGGPPPDGDAGSSPAPPLHPAVEAAYQNQAMALVAKDARRNLISHRLLGAYAALLQRGEATVAPKDETFSAFLEECGECHIGLAATSAAGQPYDCVPAEVQFTMPAPAPQVPVIDALRSLAPFCSYWRTLLRGRAVDGGDIPATVTVAPMGDLLVRVKLPQVHECVVAAAAMTERGDLPDVPVLYEDESVFVVNKPAGLATSRHALSCTQSGTEMTDLVSVLGVRGQLGRGPALGHVFRQGQVHRLDRETSGCVAFAKTNEAADSLRHQMGTAASFSHDGKVYMALCVVLEPELNRLPLRGELVDPVDDRVRTRYQISRFFRSSRVALIRCQIQQGKKHQIRRHLAHAGLPILGDVEHGGAACCSPLISRVALHAQSLSFVHPRTCEVVSVNAPLPADFHRALNVLEQSS